MADDPLDDIRKTIDELDDTIIRALADRQKVVKKVLNDKLEKSRGIRDPEREEIIMDTIRKKAAEVGMDPYFLEQLFREVINHSVRYQTQALVD